MFPTTREGLAKLKPVAPDGVVTYGSQTHPADGTAGMVVTGERKARELGDGEGVVRRHGVRSRREGQDAAGARPGREGGARRRRHRGRGRYKDPQPVRGKRRVFSREMGVPVKGTNDYGSSLVYGHPQGPTGARLIAELIVMLRRRGGGTGLFTGCTAGDSGAALVLRVED